MDNGCEKRKRELIKQRAVLKAQLTRFKKLIENLSEEPNLTQLKLRTAKLTLDFEKFENVQTEIEMIDEDLEAQLVERQEFEDAYFLYLARTEDLISANVNTNRNVVQPSLSIPESPPVQSTNVISSIPSISQQSSSSSNEHRNLLINVNETETHIKIPTFQLQKFSGSYEAWPGFYDSFKSAVHDCPNLRDSQRLVYLRSCLIGRAAEKIESLETTDANYAVAWGILKSNYDDPTILINKRIKAFFELPSCNRNSLQSLGELVDNATKHYRALQALNQPFLEGFPIFAITSKLDDQTRLLWKEKMQGVGFPNMEQLLEFLHSRRKLLESARPDKSDFAERVNSSAITPRYTNNRKSQNTTQPAVCYSALVKPFCHLCRGSHFTQSCERLTQIDVDQRIDIVKNAKLCYNCLRANHKTSDCTASSCKVCQGKHHTLLHKNNNSSSSLNNRNSATSLSVNTNSQVLLATAIVYINDNRGNPHAVRAVLDSGSQSNFLTEATAAKLGLHRNRINVPVIGINQVTSNIMYAATANVKSRYNEFSTDISFLLVPRISEALPSYTINKTQVKIPSHIYLADPQFNRPAEIDLLLGAGLFYELLCIGQIALTNTSIRLQKTQFGWIVTGEAPLSTYSKSTICNFSMTELNRQVSKFWEIEEGRQGVVLSPEERECESHYIKNTQRHSSGRYIVRLPFKDNYRKLGESYNTAIKRFISLERSLNKNSNLKQQYTEFLNEYQQLGHLSPVESSSDREGHYLPHHAVIKQSSVTTKLRVVFDGSAKTSTGISFNESLMVGPTIQDDLVSILLRFRTHLYVLTADVEKMYRQILVHPDDRKFQKILWRSNSNEPIKTYQLNTVTYGTSAAPFLAIRTLHQLANDESLSYSQASIILKRDFYVDDLLTGAKTYQEAETIRDQLIELTQKGGLTLRRWASNEPRLLEKFQNSNDNVNLCLDLNETAKTLGVHWNAINDSIIYSLKKEEIETRVTKRTILSQIAQLFDPLGLLAPVIVKAKIIMRRLWQLKSDWDESVPVDMYTSWSKFRNQLPLLNHVHIPRHVIIEDASKLQLHGFCDASERAYGACLYIRSVDSRGNASTHLLFSKSKVAPLKLISLPRLELCAALLLAKLYEGTIRALHQTSFQNIIFWSDSIITLHWINTPAHTLKTFIANRVVQIQQLTDPKQWRHVPSQDNPADLVSRGMTPAEFIKNNIWFDGPSWLKDSEVRWPHTALQIPDDIPERRPVTTLTATIAKNNLLNNYSSFTKLKRIIAHCIRFINNARRQTVSTGHITTIEMQNASKRITSIVQAEDFAKEIAQLKSREHVEGRLALLNPFLDVDGILRVGGRLLNAELPYSQKHPAILPRKHYVTTLIIREEHLRHFHAGAEATLNAIRKNYWIIDGRSTVKNILHQCIPCRRAQPLLFQPIMGNLPKARVSYKRPFLQAGIDYCGPFFIKERKHRNRTKIKVYAAIFICLATRAIHIEIVSDLTTEAFLASLRRFFARRGKCTDIYTDNATNFVGAKVEIRQIQELLSSTRHNDEVTRRLTDENINWHLIPPRSPHFGGSWEAAVKSFKRHMIRTVGNTLLTFEALTTYATEVEAILNSRPLIPLSSDPNDLQALTPAHFLIGDSLTGMPEQDLSDVPSGRLSSWQHVQKLRQHFWKRWKHEYLHELTVRRKWHSEAAAEVKIGTLVVLKEDRVPPIRWNLARVIDVHPGGDGVVRVATVKTISGIYKRAVRNLSPLLLDDC